MALYSILFAPKTIDEIFRISGLSSPPPIQIGLFSRSLKIHNIFNEAQQDILINSDVGYRETRTGPGKKNKRVFVKFL